MADILPFRLGREQRLRLDFALVLRDGLPEIGQIVMYRTGSGLERSGVFTGVRGTCLELDGWLTVAPSEVTRLLPMAESEVIQ